MQLTNRKSVGGRRIQFTLADARRGNSDWYSIKQTFVRLPNITALKCLGKECELKGTGINYILQISLDGSKTWFPSEPTGLTAKAIENGLETALIPNPAGVKSVKIKLRDFSVADGVLVSMTNR
jgi:hypothetical protein